MALASASLVFGGVAFQLYYRIPIVGGLFRRPMKFLDLYTFAQALLTGAAVTCLQAWAHETPNRLWQHPAWLAALGFAAAVSVGLYTFAISNWYVVGALGALVLFGLVRAPAVRLGLVGVLCLIQAASLFFSAGDTHLRPLRRPRLLQTYDPLFASLAAGLGDGRIYLSPQFMFLPGLTHKQGTLQRMSVVVDYEPLATSRYARFFAAVSPGPDQQAPFAGSYLLTESSRWRLMDLTGTRFFVMMASEPGASYMAADSAEFERVWQRGVVRVYRRRAPLPRALVVARARVLPTPDDVLSALQAPDFDPRAEVLMEEHPEGVASPAAAAGPPGDVTMTTYTPEYVELATRMSAPGFLVLGDISYPGWKAFVDGHEVPILRANYLFRAVRLEPGRAEVRFEYRPRSFRLGVAFAVATGLAIGVAMLVVLRRGPSVVIPS